MARCKKCRENFVYRNTVYCAKDLCFNCSKQESLYGKYPFPRYAYRNW